MVRYNIFTTANSASDEGTCCADVLAAYGLFLQNVQGEYDRAESMFKLSLQSNPTHLDTLQNYAIFLEEVRGDLDKAEGMYAVAVESTRNGLLDGVRTPSPQVSVAGHAAIDVNSMKIPYEASRRKPAAAVQVPAGGWAECKGHGKKVKSNNTEIDSAERQTSGASKQSLKRERLKENLRNATHGRKAPGNVHISRIHTPTLFHVHGELIAKEFATIRGQRTRSGITGFSCCSLCTSSKANFRIEPCDMTGSSHGRVDAERRFTDGTYHLADDHAAGTRHQKEYTGVRATSCKLANYEYCPLHRKQNWPTH